jgi:trimeric autotransporter adhesin
MKSFILFAFISLLMVVMPTNKGIAQNTGIGTTTPTAKLQIAAANPAAPTNQDGILIPRINVFPATAPTVNQNGMMVFLTTSVGTNLAGFYYWDNALLTWKAVGANTGWGLKGNTGTNEATNFIGTTDANDVIFKRNNVNAGKIGLLNTSFGTDALNPLSTGINNTAFGRGALFSNTSGVQNTAIGQGTLSSNIDGYGNTAIGSGALTFNINGTFNTANGNAALRSNNTGSYNTANGSSALFSNNDGNFNTAIGVQALNFNTSGIYNTANGYVTLYNNINGNENTATGSGALFHNIDGSSNIANGINTLFNNINGNSNTANGNYSLYSNTTGSSNTALGAQSLSVNSTGSGNVAIGFQAGSNAKSSNKLYIENTNADSLNALIYGDFAADSLLLNAKVNIRDFTRLGTRQSGAPAIKMKKLTTTSAALQNATVTIAHGLTRAKILSVQVLLTYLANADIPASYLDVPGYEYNWQVNNTDVLITNKAANSGNILSKPIRILITYEE